MARIKSRAHFDLIIFNGIVHTMQSLNENLCKCNAMPNCDNNKHAYFMLLLINEIYSKAEITLEILEFTRNLLWDQFKYYRNKLLIFDGTADFRKIKNNLESFKTVKKNLSKCSKHFKKPQKPHWNMLTLCSLYFSCAKHKNVFMISNFLFSFTIQLKIHKRSHVFFFITVWFLFSFAKWAP